MELGRSQLVTAETRRVAHAIFFAVARRRPVPGPVTGLQDIFASPVIGLNGIAKTMIGYLASSLGVRIDVENLGSRFLMTFAFCLLHRITYMSIDLALVGGNEPWLWGHTVLSPIANALLPGAPGFADGRAPPSSFWGE